MTQSTPTISIDRILEQNPESVLTWVKDTFSKVYFSILARTIDFSSRTAEVATK
jgi:hypothetical protein